MFSSFNQTEHLTSKLTKFSIIYLDGVVPFVDTKNKLELAGVKAHECFEGQGYREDFDIHAALDTQTALVNLAVNIWDELLRSYKDQSVESWGFVNNSIPHICVY